MPWAALMAHGTGAIENLVCISLSLNANFSARSASPLPCLSRVARPRLSIRRCSLRRRTFRRASYGRFAKARAPLNQLHRNSNGNSALIHRYSQSIRRNPTFDTIRSRRCDTLQTSFPDISLQSYNKNSNLQKTLIPDALERAISSPRTLEFFIRPKLILSLIFY